MKIPILKLESVLLTSIHVDLTDEEAIEFQSDLLNKVAATDARGVVIDITAMDVVDSYMARVLNETVAMVKLFGTHTVVTGMQPMVALSLVEMGRELLGVDTALNLEQGYRKLVEMLDKGEPYGA